MRRQKKSTEDIIVWVDDPGELTWDIEVDVLVISGGGCGLVAALAAAEKGAQVFLVEKDKNPGGNPLSVRQWYLQQEHVFKKMPESMIPRS